VEWQDNFDDIDTVRKLLDSAGRSQTQVWVTEWGWSSSVGEDVQAAYVRRSLEMLRSQYQYVAVATLFLDADRPGEYDYGLLDANFTLKPAGTAFAAFMRERAAPSTPSATDAPESPGAGSVQGGAEPSAPTASPASPDTRAPAPRGDGPTQSATKSPASTSSSSPPPVAARSGQSVRLMGGKVALTARTAKVGRRFAVKMRVSWRPETKPLPRASIAATASVGGARVKLVKSGWDRSTAYAEWRVPSRARGKKLVGSIMVRYGDSVVEKRFSASVR
jgi:hypothetical protein